MAVEASLWASVYLVAQEGARRTNKGVKRNERVLDGKGAMGVPRGTRRTWDVLVWTAVPGRHCEGLQLAGEGGLKVV